MSQRYFGGHLSLSLTLLSTHTFSLTYTKVGGSTIGQLLTTYAAINNLTMVPSIELHFDLVGGVEVASKELSHIPETWRRSDLATVVGHPLRVPKMSTLRPGNYAEMRRNHTKPDSTV